MYCFWSAKGGAGCTVSATAAGLVLAETVPTLLVDLGGDVMSVLGSAGARAGRIGVADWLQTVSAPAEALTGLEVEIHETLSVLPWGYQLGFPDVNRDAVVVLGDALRSDPRMVVVDVGIHWRLFYQLLIQSDHSWLVTRSCYLALCRAISAPGADGVVVVREVGRTFNRQNIEDALGAVVVLELPCAPEIARVVDAGLLASHIPDKLAPLRSVLAAIGKIDPEMS